MATRNGSKVKAEAAEQVETAAERVSELGREARQRAEAIRKDVIKQLNDAAEAMRQEARDSKLSDDLTRSIDEIAKGLERSASGLGQTVEAAAKQTRKDADQTLKQAERAARDNPTQTLLIVLLIGVIVGFLLRGSGRK